MAVASLKRVSNKGKALDALIKKIYMIKWREQHPENVKRHRKNFLEKNPDYLKEYKRRNWISTRIYDRRYKMKNHQAFQAYWLNRHQKDKLKALQLISGLEKPLCADCKCSDLRILEIDHINGGGTKEIKSMLRKTNIHREVAMGRRKTDDLRVLCKVCNVKHDVKRRFMLDYKVELIGGVN